MHSIDTSRINEKVQQVAKRAAVLMVCAPTLIEMALCGEEGDGASWITGAEEVTVDIKSLNGNSLINHAITLVCGVISVTGLFTIAQGWGAYSAAHAEDNSAGESKGMRKMIAGVIAALTPWIFKWLVGGSVAG